MNRIKRKLHGSATKLVSTLCLSVGLLVLGGIAHAVEINGINDPARDAYYNAFKDKKVVFVPVFMGLPLTEGWSKAMQLQADRLGYHYEVRNANFDTSAGTQILTSLIKGKDKPDVIVVHNPDVTSYKRLEQEAEKAGIYVIQMNMKSLATTTGFAGGDATRIAEMEAKAVVDQCGAGTDTSHKVLILTGPTTAPWSVYLNQGYKNVFTKESGVNVVSIQSDGNYSADKEKQITNITLQQHPDLCAVVSVWDVAAVGAAAAIEQAGKKDQVFLATNGGGGKSVGCRNIENDNFDYYVSFDVPGQGRDINNLIEMALEQKAAGIKPGTTKTLLYSKLTVLNKQNIHAPGSTACWTVKDMH